MCYQCWKTLHRSGHPISEKTNLLESLQRKFTRWLPGLRGKTYMERLKVTGLERLDVRRLRLDLLLTYKIIFGLNCLELRDFFALSPVKSTRGHAYKLFVSSACTDIKKYFFSTRVIAAWNNLPKNTNFKTLASFRLCLENCDLSKYCVSLR